MSVFQSATGQLRTTRDFNAGIGLVRMLGQSNVLALVGGGRQPKFAQNRVVIWDEAKARVALELAVLTTVRGVRLQRSTAVVVLQNSVRLFTLTKPARLVAAYETADNVRGLCAMSEERLAFPGRTPGHVQLVETATHNVSIIPAHASPLRAIELSRDGEVLATAGETGTLIRLWATSSCARIAELRRGIDPAAIYCLAFSPSGNMVACTSDKATLHIFDVPRHNSASAASTSPSSGQRSRLSASSSSAPGSPRSPRTGTTPPPVSPLSPTDDGGRGRWGILGKIPLMPRLFSDVYSFASHPFEAGDDPYPGLGITPSSPLLGATTTSSSHHHHPNHHGASASQLTAPGGGYASLVDPDADGSMTLGTGRPVKGIIGWVDEDALVVVGAGRDARWERFALVLADDGRRVLVREGWKRYLGSV